MALVFDMYAGTGAVPADARAVLICALTLDPSVPVAAAAAGNPLLIRMLALGRGWYHSEVDWLEGSIVGEFR
jgi:hypothetical protein